MKTKLELEQKIVNITSLISKEFPELSKYISEMPQDHTEKDRINIQSLEDYFNSLVDLLNEYSKTHMHEKIKRNSNS